MKLSGWPYFAPDEIDSVQQVLASGRVNYWTGEQGKLFEVEFADYVGTRHAIALANGTLALELALRALGIGEGDEVIVTPRTFIASASAVVMVGAIPVFADVDPVSQNITAQTIAPCLSNKTRAIICVHLAGWPCEMDEIRNLVDGSEIKLVEDCAQAHGAQYKQQPIGSLGDVAAFSFCQDKIMTTGGEGGMLTLNDEAIHRLAWSLKDHGKDWDLVFNKQHPPGFRWLHERFGSNYRMTEMQAAIGRLQLNKLDSWKELRQRNASMINAVVEEFDFVRPTIPPDHIEHAHYKHYVFLEEDQFAPGWNRDRLLMELCDQGVPCYSGSCSEVYLEKAFLDLHLQTRKRLPVAKQLGESSLMFLVHPTLGHAEMVWVCEVIESVFKKADKNR